jgi:hypothetical protein
VIAGRFGRRSAQALVVALAMLLTFGAAWSYWATTATGTGAATAATVGPGAQPSASVADGTVTVTWPATTLSNGDAVDGYVVTRYDGNATEPQTTLSSCAGTVTATTCAEADVPAGSWTYTVTPLVGQSWRGAESPRSDAVAVSFDAIPLGDAARFSVLGATGVTSTEPSVVSGDLGVSPSDAVVGFPPGVVGGDIHAGDALAADAQADLLTAYDQAAAMEPTSEDFAGDLNGRTFSPGVHHTGAALTLTGNLTLDGGGDPNAVFVFQVNGALGAAADSNVILTGGAKASNVYWQVLGAADTGRDATFAGTIMATGAITLGLRTELIGRALSRAAVTMHGATVRFTEALPPAVTIDGGGSALTKDASPTISGTTTADAGRTVTVTVGGQTLTTTVASDGTWQVTAADLAANDYTLMAKVRDAAGNTGYASQQLTVELIPAPVDLGRAASFSVYGTGGVGSTGLTVLSGDLGASPGGPITGFPPGIVEGETHAGDTAAAGARTDADAAYADLAGRPHSRSFAGDQIGKTFRPGIHRTTAAFANTGTLTFDADGNPDAIFIVQIGAALTTGADSEMVLANGAQASNIHWQVLDAATLGARSEFLGTIHAQMAVTVGADAAITGRVLSSGAVTLAANAITTP